MPGAYIAFLCTGTMRPGTIGEGLAYAWPYLLLAVVMAVLIFFVPKIAKHKYARIALYAVFIAVCAASLAFGKVSFDIGKDCNPAEPSEYDRRLQEKGIE